MGSEYLEQVGYKLFRKRKDGSYGPLFIGRRQRLYIGTLYVADSIPTKGYAFRPGWHICSEPIAPHLSKKNRVWCKVSFNLRDTIIRPKNQGGIWYLGSEMIIIGEE